MGWNLVRDQGVGGSNPLSPTNQNPVKIEDFNASVRMRGIRLWADLWSGCFHRSFHTRSQRLRPRRRLLVSTKPPPRDPANRERQPLKPLGLCSVILALRAGCLRTFLDDSWAKSGDRSQDGRCVSAAVSLDFGKEIVPPNSTLNDNDIKNLVSQGKIASSDIEVINTFNSIFSSLKLK